MGRTSLVIDLKDSSKFLPETYYCFAIQSAHTLLFHSTERAIYPRLDWTFIDMQHLILLGVPFPYEVNLSLTRLKAISLTAIDNEYVFNSIGLKNYMFKHIHLSRCELSSALFQGVDELLFTVYVETLVIEEGEGVNPMRFQYYLAPNLRRLSIIKTPRAQGMN